MSSSREPERIQFPTPNNDPVSVTVQVADNPERIQFPIPNNDPVSVTVQVAANLVSCTFDHLEDASNFIEWANTLGIDFDFPEALEQAISTEIANGGDLSSLIIMFKEETFDAIKHKVEAQQLDLASSSSSSAPKTKAHSQEVNVDFDVACKQITLTANGQEFTTETLIEMTGLTQCRFQQFDEAMAFLTWVNSLRISFKRFDMSIDDTFRQNSSFVHEDVYVVRFNPLEYNSLLSYSKRPENKEEPSFAVTIKPFGSNVSAFKAVNKSGAPAHFAAASAVCSPASASASASARLSIDTTLPDNEFAQQEDDDLSLAIQLSAHSSTASEKNAVKLNQFVEHKEASYENLSDEELITVFNDKLASLKKIAEIAISRSLVGADFDFFQAFVNSIKNPKIRAAIVEKRAEKLEERHTTSPSASALAASMSSVIGSPQTPAAPAKALENNNNQLSP